VKGIAGQNDDTTVESGPGIITPQIARLFERYKAAEPA